MFRKVKYYKSCKDLPIKAFIDVLETSDLKYLVVSGKPNKNVLEKVWNNIFKEYQNLMGSKSEVVVLRQFRYVYSLKFRIDILSNALVSLSAMYNNDLVEFLMDNGIRTRIRRSSFVSDFKKAQTELKSLQIHLNQQQDQLNKMTESTTNVREDFTRMLIQISQFLGYDYSASHTVFEFTVAIKEMNRIINKQNTSHGKRA